jgi:hypothetical protein
VADAGTWAQLTLCGILFRLCFLFFRLLAAVFFCIYPCSPLKMPAVGTPEGLSIVSELAPNSLSAPNIPKPAAPEALKKSRLDQLRPSVFTTRHPGISLLLIATIELSPVQVCRVDYSRFDFYAF